MARGSKVKTDISARRREVGRWYLSGKTQPEIAKLLDVSQPTISRDLKYLRIEWIQSAIVDINEAKSKELAKIDVLEVEYWEAWRRSIGDYIQETTKAKGLKDGRPTDVEKTLKKDVLVGDPRFLQGVQWCIDKRCQILGLDAPQVIEVSWEDEVVDLLQNGEVDPGQVKKDFGVEMAQSLFAKAGIVDVTSQ